MGLFKTGFKSLIKLLLPLLLMVNLYIGLIEVYGSDFNILGVPLDEFNTGFFGFRSLLLMIKDYPDDVFPLFFDSLKKLFNVVFFNIPTWIENGGFSINNFTLKELILLLLQPIYVIVYAAYNIGSVLYGLVMLIIVLFKAMGGYYSIPYDSPYPDEPIIINTFNYFRHFLV